MLFLTALVFASLVTIFLDKQLKKHPGVFYCSAVVISAAVTSLSQIKLERGFFRDNVVAIFSHGAMAAAFWVIVMWAAAFPNGSAPIKKIMPIRGELSITAAILTLSHAVTYSIQYITSIINKRTGTGDAFRTFAITCGVSVTLMLIMIPLTVMSFKAVRKKMNAKTWKKIQRAAYIFYALIYIHIMVLFIPKANRGTKGVFFSIAVYSVVFIGYAVMRIRKQLIKSKKLPAAALNVISVIVFAGLMATALLISGKDTDNSPAGGKPVEATGPRRQRPSSSQTDDQAQLRNYYDNQGVLI